MNDDGLKMTLGVGLIDIHITPNTVHAITAVSILLMITIKLVLKKN